MRISVKTSLKQIESPEDSEAFIRWYITASAEVRESRGSAHEPGEWMCDDLKIEAVHNHFVGYGTDPQNVCFTDSSPVSTQANEQALRSLRRRLGDRDDWQEEITTAIRQEAERRLGVPHRELVAA